jgi:peptide chain release factor 1
MQDERSQHKNKDKAMKVLRARIYELERRKLADARADQRRSLIGSGDRSERVRTYNYKEGRVKDHRINLLLNDLPGLMDGGDSLGEMLAALKLEERRQLMAEFSVSPE